MLLNGRLPQISASVNGLAFTNVWIRLIRWRRSVDMKNWMVAVRWWLIEYLWWWTGKSGEKISAAAQAEVQKHQPNVNMYDPINESSNYIFGGNSMLDEQIRQTELLQERSRIEQQDDYFNDKEGRSRNPDGSWRCQVEQVKARKQALDAQRHHVHLTYQNDRSLYR